MNGQGDALRQLGQQIAKLRQERQLSIETLASLTGLDPGDLIAIEAGKIDVPLTTIFHLTGALGITPEDLVNRLWE